MEAVPRFPSLTRVRAGIALIATLLALGMMAPTFLTATAQQATPGATPGTTPGAPVPSGEIVFVQVVHGIPGAPAVDIYVDGVLGLAGIEPVTSSDFISPPAGPHRIQLTPTGEPVESAIVDTEVTLTAGAGYRLAALGTLDDVQVSFIEVDTTATAPDSARVTVIHGSPDAGPVDVAVAGGDVLVSDLEFLQQSAGIDVPGGTYDLEVRPAGTSDVALAVPGIEFEVGNAYTVYAVGSAADGTLAAIRALAPTRLVCNEVLGTGGPYDACVRVVHGSPDAGAVDIYIDEELAVSGLRFGEATDFLILSGGTHRVQVVPTEQATALSMVSTIAALDVTLPFESGVAYDLAALGPVSDIRLERFEPQFSDIREGEARVTVIHGSADAGPVDVALAGGEVIISDASYGLASDPVAVEAGTYDFEIRPAGEAEAVLSVPGVELEAGQSYQLYAIGSVGDGSLTVLPLSIPGIVGTSIDATPDASPVA